MAKHVKRSVLPIYLVGVVWLGYALLFPLRTAAQYALCAGVSLVAFVIGKAVFPDKVYTIAGEPEKKETAKAEAKKAEPKPPAIRRSTPSSRNGTGRCPRCAA